MNVFKDSIKKSVKSFVIWGLGCTFGLLVSPMSYNIYSSLVATPGNVVALNTDTINKIAIACDLLHRNSDMMGRYSHYLTPHYQQELFCMECSGQECETEHLGLGEPTDDFYVRLSQVYDDSREINRSLGSMINALAVQNETLHNNLQKLRDQSHPK
mgnify:CR=1 FL=1